MPQANAFTRAAWPPRQARGGRAVVYRRKAGSKSTTLRIANERVVGVRPEQTVVDVGRGIELCYEQIGDPDDPPFVLIAGLGQQLHGSWPTDFATALAGRGYRVTRFDNRDVGRSTHMDFPPPKPLAILRGGSHPRQYHLGDMARDTVGLLDVARLSGCAPGRHLDGRHDRADRRRALSGPGAHADVDHVHHGCAAYRPPGDLDMAGGWRPPSRRARRRRRWQRDMAIFRHIGSHGFPFDEERVREQGGHRLGPRPDQRRHAAPARGNLPLR